MRRIKLVLVLGLLMIGCTTSRVVPADNSIITAQTKSAKLPGDSRYPVTVFLLERDIPQNIKRLGVVLISVPRGGVYVDRLVKGELQKKCQELGANGAYRLNEGYYPTNILDIPYLVFNYEKSANN